MSPFGDWKTTLMIRLSRLALVVRQETGANQEGGQVLDETLG